MQAIAFHIGEKPEFELVVQHFRNPIRQALWYKQLLDEGRFSTQAELAQGIGISRSEVASVLRLLQLAPEIQEFMIDLVDADSRLHVLTERRLRSVVQIDDADEQCDKFREMIDGEGSWSASAAS